MDTEYIFEYDGGPEMKKTIFIAGMVIVIMLSIISWFVLPETVSVQVGLDGEISNTMPKLFAILIPAVMSVIGGIIGIKSKVKKEIKKASVCKRLINPDDCNPKCIMGFTFVMDGEKYQKCRYMAFQPTLSEENNPYIKQFLEKELQFTPD